MNSFEESIENEMTLVNQIELEMRKIHTSVIKLCNNQSVTGTNDPLEQCLIRNYCYLSSLFEKGVDEDITSGCHDTVSLKKSIQKELDFLINDLQQLMCKIQENKHAVSNIETNISNLTLMTEASNKKAVAKKNVTEIIRNIKMRFKKEKSDLKTIITTLFADNLDIQDLIAEIIEHHFNEGSDKYLQLENGNNTLEQIETLRKTNLFEVNPLDPLQIRLADLL